MFDFELNLFYQSKKVERAGDSKQFQKHADPQVFLNLFYTLKSLNRIQSGY